MGKQNHRGEVTSQGQTARWGRAGNRPELPRPSPASYPLDLTVSPTCYIMYLFLNICVNLVPTWHLGTCIYACQISFLQYKDGNSQSVLHWLNSAHLEVSGSITSTLSTKCLMIILKDLPLGHHKANILVLIMATAITTLASRKLMWQ